MMLEKAVLLAISDLGDIDDPTALANLTNKYLSGVSAFYAALQPSLNESRSQLLQNEVVTARVLICMIADKLKEE